MPHVNWGYPRPQLVRPYWLNLDGLWNLCITRLGQTNDIFAGKIRVPFPVESFLSGVKQSKRCQSRMALR